MTYDKMMEELLDIFKRRGLEDYKEEIKSNETIANNDSVDRRKVMLSFDVKEIMIYKISRVHRDNKRSHKGNTRRHFLITSQLLFYRSLMNKT